jgi:allantoin racemase
MIGDMAQQSHSRYVAQDGADVVIMGCAGMARHRRPLEDVLDVPVIDPTQAAVAMAIGTVQAGL